MGSLPVVTTAWATPLLSVVLWVLMIEAPLLTENKTAAPLTTRLPESLTSAVTVTPALCTLAAEDSCGALAIRSRTAGGELDGVVGSATPRELRSVSHPARPLRPASSATTGKKPGEFVFMASPAP